MGQMIWGVLAAYEGRWVAVDGQGRVAAHAPTLAEARRAAGSTVRRLTFLYAAPGERAESALRS